MSQIAGRLFYIATLSAGAVGSGLTGVAGERKGSATRAAKEDLRVLAGITDLLTSKVTARDLSGAVILTNGDVLIRNLFGKNANAKPWMYWTPPLSIKEGNGIEVDTLNVGGETGGTLVMVADPVKALRTSLPDDLGYPFRMLVSLGLTGVANEEFQRETVADQKYHTIFWGAATDISASKLRITDPEGQPWSTDFLPIWSYCGLPTGQVYYNRWPRPYFCKAGGALAVEVKNAAVGPESNGFITFFCSRIPVNQ